VTSAENAGADQVARSKLVRLAAVLRANLSDKIPGHNRIARPLDLFENVPMGFSQ